MKSGKCAHRHPRRNALDAVGIGLNYAGTAGPLAGYRPFRQHIASHMACWRYMR
jgi:hypothetical protein